MTKRERIVNEVLTALQEITILNGYVTDSGDNVFLDRSSFDEDETKPFINIDEGEDAIIERSGGGKGSKFRLNLPLTIEGYNSCDPLNPSSAGHDLIGDIKKCLFSYVFSTDIVEIDYQSSTIAQHESGSNVVVINVLVDIIYIETVGNPEE